MPGRRALPVFVFAFAVSLAGCFSDDDHGRSDAQSLSVHEGDAAAAAVTRLVRRGKSALPAIEAALHTAKPAGRKNLVTALRKIGDADAIPLLRHVALYDDEESVRHEAEWTLQGWAAELDARGDRARRAMREIEERRGREAAG